MKAVTKIKRPPLGIMPLWLHNEIRLKELNKAISRYKKAKLELNKEWLEEALELKKYLKERKKK